MCLTGDSPFDTPKVHHRDTPYPLPKPGSTASSAPRRMVLATSVPQTSPGPMVSPGLSVKESEYWVVFSIQSRQARGQKAANVSQYVDLPISCSIRGGSTHPISLRAGRALLLRSMLPAATLMPSVCLVVLLRMKASRASTSRMKSMRTRGSRKRGSKGAPEHKDLLRLINGCCDCS